MVETCITTIIFTEPLTNVSAKNDTKSHKCKHTADGLDDKDRVCNLLQMKLSTSDECENYATLVASLCALDRQLSLN